MTLFGRFQRKPDPQEVAARQRLRDITERILGQDPPVSLTISEIDCGDPVCPGIETIILVMREGEATQAVKIRKPMVEVSEADLHDALKYL